MSLSCVDIYIAGETLRTLRTSAGPEVHQISNTKLHVTSLALLMQVLPMKVRTSQLRLFMHCVCIQNTALRLQKGLWEQAISPRTLPTQKRPQAGSCAVWWFRKYSVPPAFPTLARQCMSPPKPYCLTAIAPPCRISATRNWGWSVSASGS